DQVLRVRDELGIGPEPEGDGPPERGERARLEDRPEPEAERECQRRDAENRQASVAPALRRGARKDPAEHIFRSITKRSALSCYGRTPAKSRGTGRISWSASRGDARSASSARPEQTRRSRRRSGGGGAEDYAARLAAEQPARPRDREFSADGAPDWLHGRAARPRSRWPSGCALGRDEEQAHAPVLVGEALEEPPLLGRLEQILRQALALLRVRGATGPPRDWLP